MAKTAVVKKPFPYATDGVTIETLKEGRILSFPDRIFAGLEKDGYVEPSDGEPENSVDEARERDLVHDEIGQRLAGASDQALKDIIARSGQPVNGNLVHADLVARAHTQLRREANGQKPVRGVDPNSGVTEQPLAKPGEAPSPATKRQIADAKDKSVGTAGRAAGRETK